MNFLGEDIEKYEKILVMGHVVPDGDSVSSALAVARRLGGALFVPGKVSEVVKWVLDDYAKDVPIYLCAEEAVESEPDAIVVVDCAPEEERTEFPFKEYLKEHRDTFILNIDHHPDRLDEESEHVIGHTQLEPDVCLECHYYSEKGYAEYLYPGASSTAEVMVMTGLTYPFLYVGLATDTGHFKFSHPRRAMYAVLHLDITDELIGEFRSRMRYNLEPKELQNLFASKFDAFRLSNGRKVFWVCLADNSTHLNWTFIDLTRGFSFAAIIQPNGRVSFRSCDDDVDMAVFAARYGGGGHPKASGCKIDIADVNDFVAAFEEFAEGFGPINP